MVQIYVLKCILKYVTITFSLTLKIKDLVASINMQFLCLNIVFKVITYIYPHLLIYY